MPTAKAIDRQATDAILVFNTKMDFSKRSDREIRLVIRSLQEVLAFRLEGRKAKAKNKFGADCGRRHPQPYCLCESCVGVRRKGMRKDAG